MRSARFPHLFLAVFLIPVLLHPVLVRGRVNSPQSPAEVVSRPASRSSSTTCPATCSINTGRCLRRRELVHFLLRPASTSGR